MRNISNRERRNKDCLKLIEKNFSNNVLLSQIEAKNAYQRFIEKQIKGLSIAAFIVQDYDYTEIKVKYYRKQKIAWKIFFDQLKNDINLTDHNLILQDQFKKQLMLTSKKDPKCLERFINSLKELGLYNKYKKTMSNLNNKQIKTYANLLFSIYENKEIRSEIKLRVLKNVILQLPIIFDCISK
ncbi:hypothetical protein [Acanthamoeba castellanii mimivirus]|uniref:Uncharacterized protein L113 n=5 Tax=Mimivirus TaxID=315393 RepID=YL113_MIMIV|nr:hypothetical protein MIMI_gp0129 [Acanthamoeba polyphaga mimivirus]Q5UPI5.1 RecName: Full=Uncharacterized protein L113 [Acanthamoeba polyphaga mimivirus]AHJ39902.1 hypothetical protein [Samba virus]ALR83625.1 hypothetical protein [Niemeyer virus]AMZ02561.1 hypothetical protein [Mimivirus Bombay]QTF49013.1 hypothetical protein [Mimivirus reunion]WMV61456.1 hypothetical protein qu_118 [Mimivirus sp.]BAV61196.1 hypothetical protein [Acanthamoeba castellanii mimivirus]